MPDDDQEQPQSQAPEAVISVDLDEADPSKAVDRRANDIAASARDNERGTPTRSRFEKEVLKRMSRLSRNFDQKLANIQAENQRQIAELTADRERLRLELAARNGTSGDTDHDRQVLALQERLAAANERGDSAEAAKVTSELARLEARHAAAISGGEVRRDAGGVDPNAPRPANQPTAVPTGPTAAGKRFIDANADWWFDPEAEDVKVLAGAIYKRLTDAGAARDSDATFDKVRREVAKRFPEYEIRSSRPDNDEGDEGDEGDELAGRSQPPRRAPTGGFQDRGNAAVRGTLAGSRNRRTLTQVDLKTMRAVGLDPDNNDHVIRFLKEQQAMGV